MSTNKLSDLPNIGKVLSENLENVGITTPSELIAIGSENAFIRLLTVDNQACINQLYALEGAIQNVRWHDLDQLKKDELKVFYKMCKNK